MKTVLMATAIAGLVGSAALAPAFADGPRASSGNNWPGMSQPVEPPAAAGGHWEWQFAYGHHGKPSGEWVYVR
jgi:hypothetical protein